MPELGIEFREPWLLLGVVLVPLAFVLATRSGGTIGYSSIAILATGATGWRVRLQRLPAVLLALATAALVIAAAGPRTVDATTSERKDGIAIMLVVDRSGSMDARDFVSDDYSASRLDAVKKVLREFVLGGESTPGRPDDLIGLVVFGTYVDGLSPLTLDHGNLMQIIGDLEVARDPRESATAIGDGLALAVERLREAKAKSKVIVLLTDGVNNEGELDPLQAAELAVANDIRVYAIGAGTNGVAPMPMRTGGGRTVLRPQRVEIDERTLKRIAERTNARYFNARNAQGLLESYAEIDRLERTEITRIRYVEYDEHYVPLVALALTLLLLAEIASHTFLRRLP